MKLPQKITIVLKGLIVSLCMASASVSAQHAKPVKVFLLGGQSNMTGQLKEYWADVESPYKDPFPQIQLWQNKRNQWAATDGPQYLGFVKAVQEALADLEANQVPYEIAGMLWLQGESDAVETMGAEYEQNLADFIVHMRSYKHILIQNP